jgi:tripartite-type tricarboxylate transporter receptor subunit TctC
MVTTANDFPPKTVPEFIAYAKQHPGAIRYGTVGVGSYPHYDMAYFAKRAGDLELSALPNRNGAAGVIQDMLRGDIQAAFLNVASTAGMVQAGQLRPLAVVNRTRLPEYPGIPTMQELGFPDVGTVAWQGLFAPAATPKPVHREITEAELQYRSEQVARRRADLARGRAQALGTHHQGRGDRPRAVTCPSTPLARHTIVERFLGSKDIFQLSCCKAKPCRGRG